MTELWLTLVASFGLVFVAELGDKTQLICLTLATRHRPLTVWAGATLAFALLNLLAVAAGQLIAQALPRWVLSLLVALLFAFFAWRSWREAGETASADTSTTPGNGFFAAFSLILLGELGDKTQLAVAALAVSHAALPVWAGATLALSLSALLASLLGAYWLARLPMNKVQRGAAFLFAVFALLAIVAAISDP